MTSPSSEKDSVMAADQEYLVRRSMLRGYQYTSLIAPPTYIAYTLARKRNLTVNRVLRATWVGGILGISAGALVEYSLTTGSTEEALRNRRVRALYDTSALRAQDHATIGSVIFAVLTPAIFLKRANVANLLLGGAGIGAGAGLLVHWARSLSEGRRPKVPPSTVNPA